MSEDALEALDTDNESVDPTSDAEASERMDEDDSRGFVKILCYCWTLIRKLA